MLEKSSLPKTCADDRHDQVTRPRVDDLAEGPADDHAHGEIDHVALEGELLEFLTSCPWLFLLLPSGGNAEYSGKRAGT
jgi:hypothetical protein